MPININHIYFLFGLLLSVYLAKVEVNWTNLYHNLVFFVRKPFLLHYMKNTTIIIRSEWTWLNTNHILIYALILEMNVCIVIILVEECSFVKQIIYYTFLLLNLFGANIYNHISLNCLISWVKDKKAEFLWYTIVIFYCFFIKNKSKQLWSKSI